MRASTERSFNTLMWVIGFVTIVAVAVIVGIDLLGLDAEGQAETACKEHIEDGLLSPSSAEFVDVTVSDALDDKLLVQGEVDSDNELGVSLREPFECEVVDGEVVGPDPLG